MMSGSGFDSSASSLDVASHWFDQFEGAGLDGIVAKDPDGRADLVALTGQMTFPQIVIGVRSIGGFRELLEADRAGTLEDLLAA